jgi:glucosamine--fructose-6-phosphate aminotransferase (isomerizing)
MWEEIWEQPAVLESCITQNSGVIGGVVKAIKAREIDLIYIAARGTSDHAAVYGKYIFEYTLGIPVALAAPSIVTMYSQDLKLKNCLVIGISQSGKAADVIEVINTGNRSGAVTVTITNDPASPLARAGQFHLDCHAGLEKSVAATKTFSAEMMALAQLAAAWSGDPAMAGELASVPQKLLPLRDEAEVIAAKVERYRFMDECFVLARGINYAISLEAALKIQETSYVRAKAFATSDFQHGPIAMVESAIPILIFAPQGPSQADMREIIAKLTQSQVELIIVSNSPDLLAMGQSAFTIPDTGNDVISPFFNMMVAQMFACKLSLVKGYDPDKPRRLSKVTITR